MADEQVTIYVNAADPVQADMAFEAMALFKAGKLTALQAAELVTNTRGDEAIREENRATQWDHHQAWYTR